MRLFLDTDLDRFGMVSSFVAKGPSSSHALGRVLAGCDLFLAVQLEGN